MGLVAIPIGCAVLYLRDPADGGAFPPCPFRAITGLDCPGCGTGRALHQLLRGRPDVAFGLNPLAIVLVPVLLYALATIGSYALRGTPLPAVRLPSWAPGVALVVVLTFAVLRNLPFAPVAWMASFR